MAFQVQKTDPSSTTWSDPADPEHTIRLRQVRTPKTLKGSIPATNQITEVIMSKVQNVSVEGINVPDTLSVRLRVSGALESATELQSLVNLLANTTQNLWSGEHWLIGFTPTTAPAPAV